MQSKWTILFHKKYPGLKFNKVAMSKRFKIPLKTLDTVFNRGVQAARSRPNANPYQWGTARVYKFVLIENGKARKNISDPDTRLHASRILVKSGKKI